MRNQIRKLIQAGKSEWFNWFGPAFGADQQRLFFDHDAFI